LVSELVAQLDAVPGVAAVALGGSYARGTAHAASDIDLGLYYEESAPFAIEAIRRVAERVATTPPVVTNFYEWGPWVNGGAWIPTRIGKVDFLYRNVDQVRRVIRDAQQGRVELHFNQQPPYGFYSVVYLAETQAGVPLRDPRDLLGTLKGELLSYPPALKQTIVREYLWATQFTLLFARDFATRADVYNTVGCLTRGLSYLTQVLFALNETYFSSDKQAMEATTHLPVCPASYAKRVAALLARPGATAPELSQAVASLAGLFEDLVGLAGDLYQPKYAI